MRGRGLTFQRPDPREQSTSPAGNPLGFHGREHDSATGLTYFRNRYYAPDLGRFISVDPLGYVDGPSEYQFAGYSTANYSDPLELYDDATPEQYAAAYEALTPEHREQFDRARVGGAKILGYAGLGIAATVGSPAVAGAGLVGLWALNSSSRYEEIVATGASPSFGNAVALGFYDLTPVSPALELYYGYSLGSGEDLGAIGQGMNALGIVPAASAAVRGARGIAGVVAPTRPNTPGILEIRGDKRRLRRPEYVDEIKKDMLSGNFQFDEAKAIIAGFEDARDVIYLTEGQHRMNAALEIFEETGDPRYILRLLESVRDFESRSCLEFVDDAMSKGRAVMDSIRLPRRADRKRGAQ